MRLARLITTAALAAGAPALAMGSSALSGSETTHWAAPSPAAGSTASSGDDDTSPFVECLRSHGLGQLPDVAVVDGRVVLDLDGTGIDPFSDTYRDAVAICEPELPEGVELPADPRPAAPTAPSVPPAPGDGEMPPAPPVEPQAPTAPR